MLLEEFGGSVREQNRDPRRSVYFWQVSGENAENFARRIRPHTLIKRRQLDLFLEVRHSRRATRHEPLTDEDITYRSLRAAQMSLLNGRA
jgi:hypothetical protein